MISKPSGSAERLPHKHLMLNGVTSLAGGRHSTSEVEAHLRHLTDIIGAKILIGPASIYCPAPGNTGLVGMAAISTSHITCHHWDCTKQPRLQVDVYSCTDFDPERALRTIWDFWKLRRATVLFLDRTEIEVFTPLFHENIEHPQEFSLLRGANVI
jgi:S-adenosylmethionine/arginine decarboxylase-like enzyme